jgi:hypothetical protein
MAHDALQQAMDVADRARSQAPTTFLLGPPQLSIELCEVDRFECLDAFAAEVRPNMEP